MPGPLTQAVLDTFQCDDPECETDHGMLSLVAKCHPEAGLIVDYCKAHGIIACRCNACDNLIATILVAATDGGSLSCLPQ